MSLVLLALGIACAAARRIHMTITARLTFFLSVRRQCRGGPRSNDQTREQRKGRQPQYPYDNALHPNLLRLPGTMPTARRLFDGTAIVNP